MCELVNSFRPDEDEGLRRRRIFLSVKERFLVGGLSVFEVVELLSILEDFFVGRSDKVRGDFLEVLVSKTGPFFFKRKYRRLNQCRLFKGKKKVSDKEIDVAFVGKEFMELHECKVNMVRQWREPLTGKSKRGRKLMFLDSLVLECGADRKVIPCCSGFEGKFGVKYVEKLLRVYSYENIKVVGRRDIVREAEKL